MILQTARLILRDYAVEDWKSVHVYASDADLVKFMDWGPNSEGDTRNFVQAMVNTQVQKPRLTYAFAITLRENGKLIGGCELDVQEHAQGSLGYCLNRTYWGNGFATEAASALCTFGFSEFELHRIFATCRPDNIGSAKVMEKIGMQRDGLLREHFFAKGKWQDSFLYSILAHERIAP